MPQRDENGAFGYITARFPRSLEQDFFDMLFSRVQQWQEVYRQILFSELKQLKRKVRRGDSYRFDAEEDETPLQSKDLQRLNLASQAARRKVDSLAPMSDLDFEKLAVEASERHKKELIEDFQSAVQIEPQIIDHKTSDILKKWTEETVKLSDKISEDMFKKVRKKTVEAVQAGDSVEDLQESLEKALGLGENRAAFLARNELGNLYSTLSKKRQKELGVRNYIWESRDDSKVRLVHDILDGQTLAWDRPHPSEGHPGEPPNCRCEAKGKIEKLPSQPAASVSKDQLMTREELFQQAFG